MVELCQQIKSLISEISSILIALFHVRLALVSDFFAQENVVRNAWVAVYKKLCKQHKFTVYIFHLSPWIKRGVAQDY